VIGTDTPQSIYWTMVLVRERTRTIDHRIELAGDRSVANTIVQ